jgi:hypothetical protein
MDRRVVGTVEALLTGPSVSRSRYLAVSLNPIWHGAAAAPHRIIVPLECARLALGRQEITLRGLTADDCVRYLAYGGAAISPDDEGAIRIACALAAIARLAGVGRPMGPISSQLFPI